MIIKLLLIIVLGAGIILAFKRIRNETESFENDPDPFAPMYVPSVRCITSTEFERPSENVQEAFTQFIDQMPENSVLRYYYSDTCPHCIAFRETWQQGKEYAESKGIMIEEIN